MRAVIQRVKQASVHVAGNEVSRIHKGHLVFLGVEEGDTQQDLEYLVEKIAHLRIFEDAQGKMNLSLLDVEGELLVVSQFTLCGDCRKGRRPSFSSAASPETAEAFYEEFCKLAGQMGISVKKGVFRADMDVKLINDGPVTMLLDSKKFF